MKRFLCLMLSFAAIQLSFTQVAVNTNATLPHPSAMLDVTSTNKGFLAPRLTEEQRNAIANPAKGLIVFDSTLNSFFYFDKEWKALATVASSDNKIVSKEVGLSSFNMASANNIFPFTSDSAGYIYDSGGPTGNYGNDEDRKFNIGWPAGSLMCKVELISLSTESMQDSLYIFETGSASKIGLTGSVINQPYYFYSGGGINIIIQLRSNSTNTAAGFQISFTHYFFNSSSSADWSSTNTGFYYIPERIAVRGGFQTNNNWNKDSIGQFSLGYGYGTQAKGKYGFSTGYNTKATGMASAAFGNGTRASGINSFATGDGSVAYGNSAVAMGDGNAAGHYAFSVGTDNTASGNHSVAVGSGTTASGEAAFASGTGTVASGGFATALGNTTTATAYNSTAMGGGTTASGSFTTAMGASTIASGYNATAMGAYTSATGYYSTSIGYQTIAKGYASTVIGMYNDSLLATNQNSSTAGTPLFIVGNGTGSGIGQRSNAMVVYKNGDTELDNLKTLKVGNGTTISKLQAGEANAGSNPGASGFKRYVLTFPTAFTTTPKIIATAKNDPAWSNVDDTFVVSIRNISTTQVEFNIQRVDTNTGWNQNLRIEWQAWE